MELGDGLEMFGPGTVEVAATAESIFPIGTLQIVMNGEVVAATESPDGMRRLEIKEKIRVDRHSWIAARCGVPGYWPEVASVSSAQGPSWSHHETARKGIASTHYDGWRWGVFAHTSPIYLAVGGE